MARQNSQSPSGRARRSPITGHNRLSVRNQEEGYVYRVVNDVDNRIMDLQDQGYEIVPSSKVGPVGDTRVDNTSSLGTASSISVGKGIKAVVMRQKKEWYDEDQAAKQAYIDEIEGTMKIPKNSQNKIIG